MALRVSIPSATRRLRNACPAPVYGHIHMWPLKLKAKYLKPKKKEKASRKDPSEADNGVSDRKTERERRVEEDKRFGGKCISIKLYIAYSSILFGASLS